MKSLSSAPIVYWQEISSRPDNRYLLACHVVISTVPSPDLPEGIAVDS